MMRIVVTALWVVTLQLAAVAQPMQLTVTTFNAGIYVTEDLPPVPAPQTALGYVTPIRNGKLIEPTETICARHNLSFGFQYRLNGGITGRTLQIDRVTRFPPGGMVNGSGQRFFENKYNWPTTVGDEGLHTFTFDEPWEMVLGEWAFEFHYLGMKLGEQRFKVIDCAAIG
jgi:Domain of unknown function (DUF3859)